VAERRRAQSWRPPTVAVAAARGSRVVDEPAKTIDRAGHPTSQARATLAEAGTEPLEAAVLREGGAADRNLAGIDGVDADRL
jgi:hypothetical protein